MLGLPALPSACVSTTCESVAVRLLLEFLLYLFFLHEICMEKQIDLEEPIHGECSKWRLYQTVKPVMPAAMSRIKD